MKRTCHECQTAIPAGLAVIRSIRFELVAYHRECWAERQAIETATRLLSVTA